jgi:glyoxylase-like metal-dependent hydrolase (beta-lactamase superfamily II)
MVYGDRFDRLFGELKPTDAGRIRAVADTGVIDLGGGRRLASHYSPGHARHHVGLLDSATGDLYVGDAAGLYIPETGDMRPATPPPDFDLDLALASLEKFRALGPQRLLFAHFGPVTEVPETLGRAAEELRLWVETVREAHDLGMDLDHAVALVQERTRGRYAAYGPDADPALIDKYETLNGTESNVFGIMHALEQDTAG